MRPSTTFRRRESACPDFSFASLERSSPVSSRTRTRHFSTGSPLVEVVRERLAEQHLDHVVGVVAEERVGVDDVVEVSAQERHSDASARSAHVLPVPGGPCQSRSCPPLPGSKSDDMSRASSSRTPPAAV
jgi:hypothetical protein